MSATPPGLVASTRWTKFRARTKARSVYKAEVVCDSSVLARTSKPASSVDMSAISAIENVLLAYDENEWWSGE